jgi:hypothetical protein
MARTKGFKPGFASAIFREHYGDWPPKHWSEKIKDDFNQDKLWQETLAKRLERKAAREARERQELEAMGEKSPEVIALEEARRAEAIMRSGAYRAPAEPVEEFENQLAATEGPTYDEQPAEESPFADWLEGYGL